MKNNYTRAVHILLEKTWVSTYDLAIEYGIDTGIELNIPISAYSSTTGLIRGAQWNPESIMVTRTNDNSTFDYFVTGIVEWKIIGTTIYRQLKPYEGLASAK